MSIVDEKFRKVRLDQTPYLFHFMRGTGDEAKTILGTILKEERLISSNGYICFTASPVTALMDFFKTKKSTDGLPMYQPYGIGFSRDLLIKDYCARNVIYSTEDEIAVLPQEIRWRTLKLEIGKYDFEYLREWRVPMGELNFKFFPKSEILIVAPTVKDLNDLIIFHDVQFSPVENYMTGDFEPDYEEIFYRAYKGMTLAEVAEKKNDYEVSGATASQMIGEDMFADLMKSHFYLSGTTEG